MPPTLAVVWRRCCSASSTGRRRSSPAGAGQPLLQPYYDLWKLLRKGAVYSRTTTWVFRAGPVVGLAAVLVATALVPFGGCRPRLLGFAGDLILFAYLLGLARLFTVLAALDTGSTFEGMGASREVLFSALAEPALLLGLAAVARRTGEPLALGHVRWRSRRPPGRSRGWSWRWSRSRSWSCSWPRTPASRSTTRTPTSS